MWFHVSREYLGKEITMTPRIPIAVNRSSFFLYEEGDIPRICVSTSIFNCLKAIMGYEHPTLDDFKRRYDCNPYVYISDKKPYLPPNASDFRKNQEMWYLDKTEFTYVGQVNMYLLFSKRIIRPTNNNKIKFPTKSTKDEYTEKSIIDQFMSTIIRTKFIPNHKGELVK